MYPMTDPQDVWVSTFFPPFKNLISLVHPLDEDDAAMEIMRMSKITPPKMAQTAIFLLGSNS